MNKKIKQLKDQARDYYLSQEDLDCSLKEFHELVEQKFAELVIEECKNVCTSGTIEKPMGLYYAKQIEKHFGVE